MTHDPEFEHWANKVWNFGAGLGAEVSLKDFRKDIIIEVYNEAGPAGARLQGLSLLGSEFQALPDLDANANAVAIQHIKLENEGWERDVDVTEPAEPIVTEPQRDARMPARRPMRCSRCWERGARATRSTGRCCCYRRRCGRALPTARRPAARRAQRGAAAAAPVVVRRRRCESLRRLPGCGERLELALQRRRLCCARGAASTRPPRGARRIALSPADQPRPCAHRRRKR